MTKQLSFESLRGRNSSQECEVSSNQKWQTYKIKKNENLKKKYDHVLLEN